MGAYDAAASAYETLLARPTSAIARAWRQALWRPGIPARCWCCRPARPGHRGADQRAADVREPAGAGAEGARPERAWRGAPHARRRGRRGDSRLAATLDDLSVDSCRAALAADDVTTLQGDERRRRPGSGDQQCRAPAWRAAAAREGDEQQHNARALLETIEQRHFPQRFEHPVLRLFRPTALVLLPAYLLTGLLMAVQLPSNVQMRTQTALAFAPPLVDLTRFPNDLIVGRTSSLTAAEASAFSAVNLTRLANRSSSFSRARPSSMRSEPPGRADHHGDLPARLYRLWPGGDHLLVAGAVPGAAALAG